MGTRQQFFQRRNFFGEGGGGWRETGEGHAVYCTRAGATPRQAPVRVVQTPMPPATTMTAAVNQPSVAASRPLA